jgi:alkanesulfonate monooxygenase SsuD/methylene tetrahydromethanopterin reductase-like flavin-dependent oxidoreductase (luciferase family)
MRLGFVVPDSAEIATPGAVARLASRAEAIGFDSLWVMERDLFPVRLRNAGIPLPEVHAQWGPLDTMRAAAAATERIDIGINLLNVPFFSPVSLARDLAALDRLSDGRVRLGLGLGWTEDDLHLVTSALTETTPASEFLRAFKSIWAGGEVAFQGEFYSIPTMSFASPARQPEPPIFMTAFAPAAVQRSAALLNGSRRDEDAGPTARSALDILSEAGSSTALHAVASGIIVQTRVVVTPAPLSGGRALFHGTPSQVQSDIVACRSLGVAEVIVDVRGPEVRLTPDQMLDEMARVHAIASSVTSPQEHAGIAM